MVRELTEVARGVLVATSRRDLTCSTVLVHADTALLVDPAWDPDELDSLAAWIAAAGLTVAGGFATHAHHDHVLWHPDFGSAPRWASPTAAESAEAHRAELLELLGDEWPARLAALVGRVVPLVSREIPWPGTKAEIVIHDGHSAGHAAVWLAGPRVLLAGDMLSDVELPLADETGTRSYDEALTLLRPYVGRAEILVPGHGRPSTAPIARWEADRRYLDAVLSGRAVDDQRLANAGMPAAHAANIAAVT
jgi:hydroxyacylglutathione hydrolase